MPNNLSVNHIYVAEDINDNYNNKDKKYSKTITKINLITMGKNNISNVF